MIIKTIQGGIPVRIRRVMAIALSLMLIVSVFCVPTVFAAGNYYEEYAAGLDEKAYTGDDLGATYTPEATTFKVWSPSASKAQVVLYTTGSDKEDGAEKISTTDMTYNEENGVWSATINGDLKNKYYTYLITNDGTTREVVDIYAQAVGVNGNRGMVVDLGSTDPEGWENDTYKLVPNQTDANIWEIQIKDFSYNENSGISEKNRGKYLAFTEKGTTLNDEGKYATGVDYLKQLGVNYVHLNPFYDFGSIDEAGSDSQFNWGYDPKNYNAPEGSFSSDPYNGNVRINEVKQMVKALHDAGIGVIMDVVYNHTFEGAGSWFQQTVPNYYYRFSGKDVWSSGSGCGNDTASEHEMFRKYMVDSVTYWAEEYHIDGFRFDLMGLHDVTTMNAIRSSLDEIDPRLLMYGEGWSMSTTTDSDAPALATQINAGKMSERIGFFNDQIRDGLKGSVFEAKGQGYIQGVAGSAAAVKYGIQGQVNGGAWRAKAPTQNVTYASAHDNNTLYDRLVMSMKGGSKEQFSQRYDDLVAMNKLSAAIVYSSQGIPFILAGEEFARTKDGDENSYSSSAELNMLDWSRIVSYKDLVSYYAGMIEIRNNYAPFRDATTDTVKTKMQFASAPSGVLAYTIYDEAQPWKTVAVAFNNQATDKQVTLTSKGTLPEKWTIIANDQTAGILSLGEVTGSTVTVPAGGALILVDSESFNSADVPSTKGLLTVNHVNKSTGETISTTTLQGEIGTLYETEKNDALAVDYDLDSDSGNTTGKFTEEPIVVNYYYTPYSLKAQDISGDGVVSVEDVLLIQKDLAKVAAMTEEQAAIADVNCDGVVSVADVLIYQKNIAKMFVPGVGTVEVNYLDTDTGKPIPKQSPLVTRARTGESYRAEALTINYYTLDETKLPDNAEGRYTDGKTVVNYYYKYNPATYTVHVKLMDGQTWTPYLHAWDDGGDLLGGGWPGGEMTLGEDGWFTIDVTCGGSFNWIINDKGQGAQTIDMENYSSDIWVVLNVAKPNKGADDVTVYTSKPE